VGGGGGGGGGGLHDDDDEQDEGPSPVLRLCLCTMIPQQLSLGLWHDKLVSTTYSWHRE